ncbi:MAG TPA: penicillin-binding protein 2 [Candidatus Magasanikbacteria bacterium]|nr:penicillin-binding protein 2 [Candidatus Magasanikbacteria bacterium]
MMNAHVEKRESFKFSGNWRLNFLYFCFVILAIAAAARLFYIAVYQHDFYLAIATGSHELYSKLFPERGEVFIRDSRTNENYPLAMNRDYYALYFDTTKIKDDETASTTVAKLAEIFNYDTARQAVVFSQLNKRTDLYEIVEKKLEDNVMKKIEAMNLPGANFSRRSYRFYPENVMASAVSGFVGKDDNDVDVGRYGVEGYWNKEMSGSGGLMVGARSAKGSLIPLQDWSFERAADGADVYLTIDRTLQYKACERLRAGMVEFGAVSAALIMIEPDTGVIRAMCSLPDYNPNEYGKVENSEAFNNSAIFRAYEPGSIMKPIVMAAGVNEGVVSPTSPFHDSGERVGLCDTPIQNADDKKYGDVNMTGVLENSINTGMVFVAEKLGAEKFREYFSKYGFGVKTGIPLDSEVGGTVESLGKKSKSGKITCEMATASFGQGVMATPLQMVMAYGAIANGGKLMKPMIVDEVVYADGHREKTKPQEVRRVMDERTARLVSGMLGSVIENGHSAGGRIRGYYIGGKTGTAQIAGSGGYSEENTNHSFVGIAPVDDPKFVIIVKFEKPKAMWAESTATPVFHDVAEFALRYYQIPPTRK